MCAILYSIPDKGPKYLAVATQWHLAATENMLLRSEKVFFVSDFPEKSIAKNLFKRFFSD